jgi:1-acyl-sn-glycerol-3-phosphate acyltransferase
MFDSRRIIASVVAGVSRCSRVARTGVAFALFGIGAVMLGLVALPLVQRTRGSATDRRLRTQRLIHHGFRAFVAAMRRLRLIRVSVRGRERMRAAGPRLIVANHPTLIDIVLLIAELPQADCIVKKAAWSNPFLRGVVSGAGYIPNDDGSELLDACLARLREGRTLVLFPEGTRSPRGGLGPFRRGAAHLSLRSECELLPVVITCDPPTLGRGEPWWSVPDRTVEIGIEALAPFPTRQRIDPALAPPGAARQATAALRELFVKQLAATGAPHVGG